MRFSALQIKILRLLYWGGMADDRLALKIMPSGEQTRLFRDALLRLRDAGYAYQDATYPSWWRSSKAGRQALSELEEARP